MVLKNKQKKTGKGKVGREAHTVETVPGSDPFLLEVQIEFLVHELKGPISVVETGLRTLIEKKKAYGPLSDRQERTLKRALRNTRKAQEMLNGLLEVGRSEVGCFLCSSFNPLKTVSDVLIDSLEFIPGTPPEDVLEAERLDECLSQVGIFLKTAPKVADMEMHQDETKFRQILGNLVKNALHYRKERIDVHIRSKGNALYIDISDDGPGIKPEHHELVFRRYTQINDTAAPPNRNGHGLGLAGASILAKSMGGRIELKSEKGCGAKFRLIIPRQFGS